MKKCLILTLLVLFTAVFSVADAKKEKNEGGEAIISFVEETYDFGIINEKDGSVSHEFEFINTGNGNLIIIDASAQCGCTRPHFSKKPYAPGAKGKIKVTYNPKGRPGAFNKVVTVKTNAKQSKVRLRITGTVNCNK